MLQYLEPLRLLKRKDFTDFLQHSVAVPRAAKAVETTNISHDGLLVLLQYLEPLRLLNPTVYRHHSYSFSRSSKAIYFDELQRIN